MGTALSVMRNNVRRNLSDLGANGTFATDAELNQYIGEGYKRYYKIMIREGEGYFETKVGISLVANQSDYPMGALSPPFTSISALQRVTSFGLIPLKANERRFKTNYLLNSGVGQVYLPTYRMRGMNLVIEPPPSFSEPFIDNSSGLLLEYYYVPPFPVSNSSDGFVFDDNFNVVWEPMVELFATIRALEAKDAIGGVSDIATFRQTLKDEETAFIDSLDRFEYPDQVEYIGQNYTNLNWWW